MFPQEMVPQMFSNIKSIYQFHHDFLLPQLEAKMLNWDRESKIGKLFYLHCRLVVTNLKIVTFFLKNNSVVNLMKFTYHLNLKSSQHSACDPHKNNASSTR